MTKQQTSTFSITLVRHGQTYENTISILQGHLDTQLNETGRNQARLLGTTLSGQTFSHVYSSDLARARETAHELVSGSTGRVQTDHRLRERGLGKLDGQPCALFLEQARLAEATPEEFTPEGGESVHVVRDRVVDFVHSRLLNEVLNSEPESESEPESQNRVLLVSHGSTIRELIRYFHKFGHESWSEHTSRASIHDFPPNTSLNEFRIHLHHESSDSSPTRIHTVECVKLHDLSHLGEKMAEFVAADQKKKFIVV